MLCFRQAGAGVWEVCIENVNPGWRDFTLKSIWCTVYLGFCSDTSTGTTIQTLKCVFRILIIICRLTSCFAWKFFTIWTTFLFFPFSFFFSLCEKQRTPADIKHLHLSQSERFLLTFYLFICVWRRANWHLSLKIPSASLSSCSAAFEVGGYSSLSLFPESR